MLKHALELEAFRYVQRRGHHRLPYKDYVRAKELGVELPEARPMYTAGLLSISDFMLEPVQIAAPKELELERCYRFHDEDADEVGCGNAHLLAALGTFAEPFVPVHISTIYDGYTWAKLPTIDRVELSVGATIHEDGIWRGKISGVESIALRAETSDGKVFESPVCMALRPDNTEWGTNATVLVTREAEHRLVPSDLMYHLGGYDELSDSYDTQLDQFTQELNRFWAELVGRNEWFRRRVIDVLRSQLDDWKSVVVTAGCEVIIVHGDGRREEIAPPAPSDEPKQ
ncbi:MAG: hypothetical protein HOP29_11400 [Phycisphaerales bacterium]|nr:hypothetical protein [Phycisphaerales bacterium]